MTPKSFEELQDEKKKLLEEKKRVDLEQEVKNLRKKTKKKSIFEKAWDKI